MSTMFWVVLALIILCMAIPYGKLYLWDRPRRRSKSDRDHLGYTRRHLGIFHSCSGGNRQRPLR